MGKKKYQVFISSTYRDLIEERSKVSQILPGLDCIPTGMEIFTPSSQDIWSTIEQYLVDCDYYILIIGGRYGSLTKEGISFTEKEYNLAIEKQIPVIAMLHKNLDKLDHKKKEEDDELKSKLRLFNERIIASQTPGYWEEKNELALLIFSALTELKIKEPRVGWIRDSGQSSEALLAQLNTLRQEKEHLIEKLNELQKQRQSGIELADTNATFEFSGTYSVPRVGGSRKWSKKITWIEIFAGIGPALLKVPTDNTVRIRLNKFFEESVRPSASVEFQINEDSFETIRIQLEALGWVDVLYLNSTTGQPAWFWKLTEQGRAQLLRLRAIQKT